MSRSRAANSESIDLLLTFDDHQTRRSRERDTRESVSQLSLVSGKVGGLKTGYKIDTRSLHASEHGPFTDARSEREQTGDRFDFVKWTKCRGLRREPDE